MQMLVIPVTTNFLTKHSQAMEDFQLAMKLHKPVLPLMQEQHLEELFNTKCGDLQVLDKNQKDDTAISYEEKRKKFITSILVGDELAERVRKAFDAYIFLSYRKKDRKYANRLMRMIHENKVCRNFAIWYDEYLIPGENFNQAIQEALDHSHLFALAVTPNLVLEENYIRKEEYPRAVNSHKPILPIMMQETDGEMLREQYPGIPDSVDGTEKANPVSEAVLQQLESRVPTERDDPTTHDFLMGLAYLSGIDVEVNAERGLALVRSAAEAGCLEAMEKLAQMYETGEAVERDYEKTLKWCQRRYDRARELYEQNENTDTRQDYLDAMWGLKSILWDLRRMQEARLYYEKARTLVETIVRDTGRFQYRTALAGCYHNLGNLAQTEEQYQQAEAYYEQSLQMRNSLMEENTSVESCFCWAVSCHNLGELFVEQRKYQKAQIYYEKAKQMFETLLRETGSLWIHSELATTCSNLGYVLYLQKYFAKSRKYVLQAIQIMEQIPQECLTIKDRDSMEDLVYAMEVICLQQGKKKEAEKWRLKRGSLKEFHRPLQPIASPVPLNENPLIREVSENLRKVLNGEK